ncbi:MAG: hypothetical protein E6I88_04510 [Chloroflexi bacterium]|nr:MAG: hypothetical protein E6I88_04510 [Chloroflexota bacterium]TME46082.1 MAG: hypothetical protein E6I56_08060 [Chloroflexota bacterium]
MRRLGLIVAILVLTVDALYVWYIVFGQQGASDLPLRVPFVASYLVLISVCALLSSWLPDRTWRLALLGASTAGLLLVGFFALMSIGLPLFVMGLVGAVALARQISDATLRRTAAAVSVAGMVAAIVVLLAGFEITARIIACAPGAVSGSGSGSGFLSGSYTYTCQNGRAIVTWQ